MSCEFRIIDYNYAFDSASNVTASSENVNLPASNLKKYLRSKVWRSDGYFVIDSTNNKINFKHNGGSELTATITSGNYTVSELETEIDLRLTNAASANVFSVDYISSTGKWRITSTGSSFELLFGTGTNAANSIAFTIGFSEEDYTGSLLYTGPNIALHTEEWVQIDLLSTEAIDSFCVFAELGGYFNFSSYAVLKLQANHTQNFSSPAVDQTLSVNEENNVICHFFSSSQSYRYWRFKIVDPQNINLCVEVPKIVLGLATQLTQTPDMGFTELFDDASKVSKTPYGHRYTDVYPTVRALEFNYSSLPDADVLSIQDIYKANGGVSPIVIALDPTEDLWDKERFLIYGYLKQQLKVQQQFYTYFNTQLSIEEGA